MKKFFLLCLSLHVLIEGVVGLVLVAAPRQLVPEATMTELYVVINQGFAALTMVLVVAWFWPHRRNPGAVAMVLGILATFHTAIGLSGLYTATMGNSFSHYALHWVFAACFWLLWFRRQQLVVV